MFERNFYRASDQCPKCGTSNPKPKYHPEDSSMYIPAVQLYYSCRWHAGDDKLLQLKMPSRDLIVPDYTCNLCICGYEWKSTTAIKQEPETN